MFAFLLYVAEWLIASYHSSLPCVHIVRGLSGSGCRVFPKRQHSLAAASKRTLRVLPVRSAMENTVRQQKLLSTHLRVWPPATLFSHLHVRHSLLKIATSSERCGSVIRPLRRHGRAHGVSCSNRHGRRKRKQAAKE